MIKTKRELREWIKYEKELYTATKKVDWLIAVLCRDYSFRIWRFVKCLRISEYHLNNSSVKTSQHSIKAFYHDFAFILRRFQRNRIGQMCSIEIFENSFEKGLCIFHSVGG